MSGFLGEMVLGTWRLDGDDSGWVELLVFVVLAVFYVLGNLIKAKKQKLDEQGDEELAPKPIRRPLKGIRVPQQRQFAPERQRPVRPVPQIGVGPESQQRLSKTVRPPTLPQKMALEKEKTGRLELEDLAAAAKLTLSELQVEPELEGLPEIGEFPEFTYGTVEKLEDIQLGFPSESLEVEQAEYLSEILPDLADPDELTKAILHYEILGKALSLREPNEQLF